MRHAARAIIIKDDKLLVTYRNKFGSEYYILIGGGVDMGETPEQALLRELQEESGVQIANPRLVFTEDAGDMYGLQHVYLCDYVAGEPMLSPDSVEYKINEAGKNLYKPMWLPFSDLPHATFRSERLKRAILDGVQNGFPAETVHINDKYEVY